MCKVVIEPRRFQGWSGWIVWDLLWDWNGIGMGLEWDWNGVRLITLEPRNVIYNKLEHLFILSEDLGQLLYKVS
ncbi:hypothetical protein EYC84_011157 [Monilinia fructicola]|uniref:Uncharacterized protein n=1 Tax=Monilinia fructicola TaxID=38448 RepID=A0A5M9J5D1_MONFR|nr:hypothetical protein EYC84_011157 [Monilinia fructicola]